MRIVKCQIMQPARLWLSDSGRKLAVAEAWRGVDVYDLHTGCVGVGLGGGFIGRLIDGFDADDRLRVIPGKAFPLNLGRMVHTEVTKLPLIPPAWADEVAATVAGPIALSADGRRCVAAIGFTLRLFVKGASGEWAEKWKRDTEAHLSGRIRFLPGDTRCSFVETVFAGKHNPFTRYSLVVWDMRAGREAGRSTPTRRPFTHVVPVGRQLVVGTNATAGKVLSSELVVFEADHLDREPRTVASGKDPIAAVCADPLGRFVLTAAGKLVTQWDPATWLPARTFNWKIGTITCLTVNPNGTIAAAGGYQGKVAVWDVE